MSVLSLLVKQFAVYFQYILFIIGSIVIGLPHGATDNFIFYKIRRNLEGKTKLIFYLGYILFTLVALLFWFLLPQIFVVVFLLYSAFHFGQSNWFYLQMSETNPLKILQYIIWGGFVVLTPILLHSEESGKIISIISGGENSLLDIILRNWDQVIGFLVIVNLTLIVYQYLARRIDFGIFLKECLSFFTLTVLFFSTPLYLSFFTYWIFFHSFNSIIETSNLLHQSRSVQSIYGSLKKSLPLSIITYIGIGISIVLFTRYNTEMMIAVYFVIIACLTIPHMIVIQSMYTRLHKR
jgi:Brp/Blh family beta-carotene 15,15'-monooxygenase